MRTKTSIVIVVLFLCSMILSSSSANLDVEIIEQGMNHILSDTPVIELESLTNNSILFSGTEIELDVTGVNLDKVWHSWDDGVNDTLVAPYSVYLPGSDGDHILYVYANDTGGLETSSDYLFTTQDNTYIKSVRFTGTLDDESRDLAIDSEGNVYFVGYIEFPDLPIHNAFQEELKGPSDAFICKLTPDLETILYCTYFGGSGDDEAEEVVIGEDDYCYVVGSTYSSDFPTINPLIASSTSRDAFVVKLNQSGWPVFSTYLGGSTTERGYGIAVDSTNSIIAVGETWSDDFPTLNAYQPLRNGSGDGFITKINADCTTLNFSTYFGGFASQWVFDVDTTGDNAIAITGVTEADSWFPLLNPISSQGTGVDGFVAAFDGNGTLKMSSFVGGNDLDLGYNVVMDDQKRIYVIGETESSNFPTVNPFQSSLSGWSDLFVFKVNSTWSGFDFSTYLGGYTPDDVGGIDIDDEGNIYVTGYGSGINYPTYNSYQHTLNGSADFYVSMISPDGQSMQFSTYVGGSLSDSAYGIVVESIGTCIVSGLGRYDFPYSHSIDSGNTRIVRVGMDLNNPEISLVSPSNNSVVSTSQIIQFMITDAESGVAGATYNWDDNMISSFGNPFQVIVPIMVEGIHELVIVTVDTVGNSMEKKYVFEFEDIPVTTTTSPTTTTTTTTPMPTSPTSTSPTLPPVNLPMETVIVLIGVGAILVLVVAIFIRRKS